MRCTGRLRELINSVLETFVVIRICLTSFWFWLPIFYVCLFFFHLWMMVYVHPLTIIILPGILIAYSFYSDKKRIKTR